MKQRHFILNDELSHKLIKEFNHLENEQFEEKIEFKINNEWFKKTFNQTFDKYTATINPYNPMLGFTKEQIEKLKLHDYVKSSDIKEDGSLANKKDDCFILKTSILDFNADYNAFVINYIITNNLLKHFERQTKKNNIFRFINNNRTY